MTDSDLKTDSRSRIEIAMRLHDTINSVVAELLAHGGLYQYDSALARRLPSGKHTTAVTLPWLTEHLREHFLFIQNGEPRELPLSFVACVLRRWNEFPEHR